MRALLAGLMALGVITVGRLDAQSTDSGSVLRGRVIDARTATPLRDVSVVLTSGRDTVVRTRTDSTGAFQGIVSAASVIAHFSRIGYRADSMQAAVGGELPVRVAMTSVNAVASSLDPVVVRDTPARTGFEQRARRKSGGTFIRSQDIEQRKPLRTSELFRAYPGVRIDDSSGVTQLVSLRSMRPTTPSSRDVVIGGDAARIPSANARRCVLRVAMDGKLMPPDFSVDNVRPEDVMGIELYLGAATIPAEFSTVQNDAPCGIIMIWTKTGRR